MHRVLHGNSLSWVTYDPERTVSAGLQWMLRQHWGETAVRLDINLASSLDEVSNLVEQHRPGLLTLVVGSSEIAAACKILLRVRARRPECLRLVYTSHNNMRSDGGLAEAGAQIVVSEIPWLQRLVPQIASHVPQKIGGYHPLTTGLVDRLPWG